MSSADELLNSVMDAARPALEKEVEGMADNYMDGFKGMLDGANAHVRPAVQKHLAKAAKYRWKAIQSDDEADRRAYVEGAADELASAKTILVSEAVAVSEEQAATFLAGFERVLSAAGSAAKAAIGAVVSGLVSGAIKSLTGGGDGPDLSSIFPGA